MMIAAKKLGSVLVGSVLVGSVLVGSVLVGSGSVAADHADPHDRVTATIAATIAALRNDAFRNDAFRNPAFTDGADVESLAIASEVRTARASRGEGFVAISDPIGDSDWYRGDLVRASATTTTDGSTAFAATVALFDSPYSASWHFRDTGVVWSIDADLDGDEDYAAAMINVDGEVIGGVVDSDDRVLCDADVTWNATASSYGLAFPTACIGDPLAFQWDVGMFYEDYSTAMQSTDWAPDLTWAPAVGNVAVAPPPIPSLSPSLTPLLTACSPAVTATPAAWSDGFVSLLPARVLDTRIGMPTIDCQDSGLGPRNAASTTSVRVNGRGGVPVDAAAVVLNVTVTDPQAAGYVTVYPCGEPRPLASSVNFTATTTVANAVVARVGSGGSVCFFTSATTELVVDVNGSFARASSFVALTPQRLLDSRDGASPLARAAGSVTELQIAGASGMPVDAAAAVLNVTATATQAGGFVTVFPCGTERPNASHLNFGIDDTVANAVVSKIGVDGRVCLYSSAGTHLVVDVNGYYTARTTYVSLSPSRLLDSRPGLDTHDGRDNGIGVRPAGTVTRLDVVARGGVPAGATTVVLNVTAADPQGDGFVAVFPCGTPQPNASNLNFRAGEAVANAVIAKVGANGQVCLISNVPTHLVVDVNGYYP